MRITVVGCGAIGTLLACKLASAGHSVQVFQRPGATLDRIRSVGVALWDGKTASCSVRAEDDPSRLERSDIAIVTVKAFSTGEIAPVLPDLLLPDGAVLTVQNGLGNGDKLSRVLGGVNVAVGSCTYGAYRDDRGAVHLGGLGEIVFGPVERGRDWRPLEDALNRSGLSARAVDDPAPVLWGKLVVNAAINPIAALIRKENGCVLSSDGLADLSRFLAMEACSVARSVGVPMDSQVMWDRVRAVVRSTSKNTCSMLQDVLAGRPTEIEAISGEILRLGRIAEISLPATETVYRLVKGLESKVV